MQSLLAYWFHRPLRGGAEEALGALFFGTSLLSALSFLVAAPVADRVGLLNTMVFTHLPVERAAAGCSVHAVASAAAAAVLLARHVLSQMDVPTRQAYTMALVSPEERPAAAGLTASARACVRLRPRRVRADDGRGGDALAVPAGRRSEDRLRPQPLLPVPVGAPRQSHCGRYRQALTSDA